MRVSFCCRNWDCSTPRSALRLHGGGDESELVKGRHVLRYAAQDDFGLPESEFLVCRFWLIDALCLLGRQEEARDRFEDALALRNHFGSSPRISIPRPAGCGAISPRPIPWPA